MYTLRKVTLALAVTWKGCNLVANRGLGQHRTLSTDYVVVMKGTLTVLAPPPAPFDVTDKGKATYAETVEAVAREGDVVVQRGSLHT